MSLFAKKNTPTKYCALLPRGERDSTDRFWLDQSILRSWDKLREHYHDCSTPLAVGNLRARVEALGSPFAMDSTSRDLWLQYVKDVYFVAEEARRADLRLKPLTDKNAVDRRVYVGISKGR